MARKHLIAEWQGKYIGDWLILEYSHQDNEPYWKVLCTCGKIELRRASQLRLGRTHSCRTCAAKKRENSKSPYWKGQEGISFQYLGRLAFRNKEVSITMDDLVSQWQSQKGRCAYSGEELKLVYKDTNWTKSTASIDRVDSSKGYISGNIQWVHKKVNKLKMDFEEEDFLNWCTKIAIYRGGSCGV